MRMVPQVDEINSILVRNNGCGVYQWKANTMARLSVFTCIDFEGHERFLCCRDARQLCECVFTYRSKVCWSFYFLKEKLLTLVALKGWCQRCGLARHVPSWKAVKTLFWLSLLTVNYTLGTYRGMSSRNLFMNSICRRDLGMSRSNVPTFLQYPFWHSTASGQTSL